MSFVKESLSLCVCVKPWNYFLNNEKQQKWFKGILNLVDPSFVMNQLLPT